MNQPARNQAEAILSVKYLSRLYALHARLYARVQKLLLFVSLVAGASALLPIWQAVPSGVFISGCVVALTSALNVVGGFGAAAVRHEVWMRQAAELATHSSRLTLEEVDAERAKLPGDNVIIEALRTVAWNDVLASNGLEEHKRRESLGEHLMRALA